MASLGKPRDGVPATPAHLKQAEGYESDEPADLTTVLLKLGAFTLAMVTFPISSYFLSLNYIWGVDNSTGAGITAAVMANVVLFAYVFAAIREDTTEQADKLKKKTT